MAWVDGENPGAGERMDALQLLPRIAFHRTPVDEPYQP